MHPCAVVGLQENTVWSETIKSCDGLYFIFWLRSAVLDCFYLNRGMQNVIRTVMRQERKSGMIRLEKVYFT